MLCNITQNAMGQTLVCHRHNTWGGYPYPIMLCNITQNSMGQTPRGGTLLGGTLPRGGGVLPGGTLPGGTQVEQQKEYSLHGGRYASCVHAGGLSCSYLFLQNSLVCHCHNLGKKENWSASTKRKVRYYQVRTFAITRVIYEPLAKHFWVIISCFLHFLI